MLKFNPQYDGFRRLGLRQKLGHETGPIIKALNAHLKETLGAPYPVLPFEDTYRRWQFINKETGLYQTPNLPAP